MTIALTIDKDTGSVPTYITQFSDERKSLLMAADTEASISVPSDANLAVLYYDTGKDIFVSESSITLPSSSSPVSNAGVLLKPSVNVENVTTLFFRSDESAFVSVEFYR